MNIYLYWCVSLLAPECAVCVCVDVCDVTSEYQLKTTLCVRPLQTSHQGPSGTKVPSLNMCRSILSLSKRKWQGSGMGVRCGQNLKRGGWQYRGGGGLDKIVELAPLCQVCKENFPSPHYKTNPPLLASPHF